MYGGNWDIRWNKFAQLIGLHALAILGVILWVPAARASTVWIASALYVYSGFGVTVGLHRLWTHRSFVATPALEFVLLLAASCANQGTIAHWVRDHRLHHQFSESDFDPHDARRGLFFSHIGWLCMNTTEEFRQARLRVCMSDIERNPVARLSSLTLNAIVCFVLPAITSLALGDTLVSGFMVAGVVRYVAVLHATWMVNSVAHKFGNRPYPQKGHSRGYSLRERYSEQGSGCTGPRENLFVSILTQGEGWHQFHHQHPSDYRAGGSLSGWWNPGKALIDFLVLIRLASNPNTVRE